MLTSVLLDERPEFGQRSIAYLSGIFNNSVNDRKAGLNHYSLSSVKIATTIQHVTSTGLRETVSEFFHQLKSQICRTLLYTPLHPQVLLVRLINDRFVWV